MPGRLRFEPPLDGLEDRAAADGADGRKTAEDEGVAGPGHDRPLGAELHEVLGAAADFARLQQIAGRIDLLAPVWNFTWRRFQGDLL